MTPLVALAGSSLSGEIALLIANPQNRSVSFSLSQLPDGHPLADGDVQPLCSVDKECAVTQIQDNSGQVVESSCAGGNVSIVAWGTMLINQLIRFKTDDPDTGEATPSTRPGTARAAATASGAALVSDTGPDTPLA